MQAKGEVAALADTINNMTDTLATFADQVTNVAREVGVDGRLGGQANVPGAAGTWKDLTGNVNLLAANLTTQVRAIAEVATAVTKGDLTRSIQVETRGEVAELKDNINTMISNLRETTESNREQDWLKTNLAKFTGMLQGQRDLNTVGQMLLTELAPLVNAHQGTIYHLDGSDGETRAASCSRAMRTAAAQLRRDASRLGEGLVGQCAVEKKRILLTDVPPDFITISSSLGEAQPGQHRRAAGAVRGPDQGGDRAGLAAALHRRSTSPSSSSSRRASAPCFNTIEATMRTEGLLTQSQQLTVELQSRQSELQQTNEELGTKAQAARRAERRGRAQERRGRAGPPRAGGKGRRAGAHLEVQVRVPGQHVARAAHAAQLHPDPQPAARRERGGNLSPKQVEFSRNINSSGSDLLQPDQRHSRPLEDRVRHGHRGGRGDPVRRPARQHRPQLPARGRGQEPAVPRAISPTTCRASMDSDPKRLQQILKNLLSNAVKFTATATSMCASTSPPRAGAPITRCSARPSRSSPSPSRTPASASRRRSSG